MNVLVPVSLNIAGVSAINRAAGGRIAFGGAVQNLVGGSAFQNIFSGQTDPRDVSLTLTIVDVPEPASTLPVCCFSP